MLSQIIIGTRWIFVTRVLTETSTKLWRLLLTRALFGNTIVNYCKNIKKVFRGMVYSKIKIYANENKVSSNAPRSRQSPMLQESILVASPMHCLPPYSATWITYLLEVLVPSPQVTEQLDQSSNLDHLQST